jgi:hypothetical protein
MKQRNEPSTTEVFAYTVIITVVLFYTGLFTVYMTQAFDPFTQNLIYAVGRVPIVFTVLYFLLKE